MNRTGLGLAAAAILTAGALVTAGRGQAPPPPDGWHGFEGTWSAAGQRHTLPTESGRSAAIVQLSGAVVVTAGEGLGRGFRGEVVGFDDGSRSTAARFVWTDDRGDRIYGSLRGEALETGGRSTGSITGGSGRYAGLTGDVELSWQYVVRAGDGAIQCRTTALKGRYRRAAAQP